MKGFLLVWLILAPVAASASQTTRPPQSRNKVTVFWPPQPRTKLEEFENTTGSVVIMARSMAGFIQGLDGGSLRLEYDLFTNSKTGEKAYGIRFNIVPSGDDGQPASEKNAFRDYVDYEEIDYLIEGIEYLGTISPSVTELSSYEAQFRTMSYLEISTFSTPRNTARIAIENAVDGTGRLILPPSSLTDLARLLTVAKSKLDELRQPRK